MVKPNPKESIVLNVGHTEGDRSGHLHVGYNQTIYIGKSIIPTLAKDTNQLVMGFSLSPYCVAKDTHLNQGTS